MRTREIVEKIPGASQLLEHGLKSLIARSVHNFRSGIKNRLERIPVSMNRMRNPKESGRTVGMMHYYSFRYREAIFRFYILRALGGGEKDDSFELLGLGRGFFQLGHISYAQHYLEKALSSASKQIAEIAHYYLNKIHGCSPNEIPASLVSEMETYYLEINGMQDPLIAIDQCILSAIKNRLAVNDLLDCKIKILDLMAGAGSSTLSACSVLKSNLVCATAITTNSVSTTTCESLENPFGQKIYSHVYKMNFREFLDDCAINYLAFDVIFCNRILQYFAEIKSIIYEAELVLENDGLLLASFSKSSSEFVEFCTYVDRFAHPIEAIVSFATECGLQLVKFVEINLDEDEAEKFGCGSQTFVQMLFCKGKK